MHAQGEGATLVEALRGALARLAGCDADDVQVEVAVPGLDPQVPAQVTVELGPAEEREAGEPGRSPEQEAEEGAAAEEDDEGSAAADGWERASAETGDDEDENGDEEDEAPSRVSIDELDEEATAAADVVEQLLDILELPGDLQIRVLEDRAEIEIVSMGSGVLIGRRGQTLDALQELVRCAMQRQFERRSRVQMDIEGYRARRLEKYLDKAEEAVRHVLDTGEPDRLEPMDSFDRKAVHHLVAEYDGVTSHSEGREPNRRVIIEAEG